MSKKLVDLKPCPFCGGPATRSDFFGQKTVFCNNKKCKVRPVTDVYERMSDAVKAWNRRTTKSI